MPLGPPQQYIVTYNGMQLPGYAQSENDPSELGIADHYAFGWDGSISQITGLTNKNYTMEFKVWEATYRECKDQYHVASTILRSRREGFAPLFVDYTDRYFDATVKSVSYTQNVSQSRKLLTYTVDFDTRPWMTSVSGYVIQGTGDIDTDAISRTISDGGWSPVYAVLTGTDITISGYTDTERFTGFISVSGNVHNLMIDTENSSSSIPASGTADGFMLWKDYGMWVGPGKTTWATTGIDTIYVSYSNRWY